MEKMLWKLGEWIDNHNLWTVADIVVVISLTVLGGLIMVSLPKVVQ